MSDAKKGKKRPKSYYIKCAKGKRQKRANDLDIGMKGFLITCNTHEKEAVRESYNILNEYADELYGPEEKLTRVDKDDSASDSDDDDMEKAMAKEVSEIKDRTPVERRFQNVDCKAKNCIFIKTILDSPTDLAHAIFTDLEEKKVQKTRHAIRMLPISATCKAVVKNIEETAEKLFKPYFETEFGVGLRYTSICKIRNNQSVSRMAIQPSLGRIIKEMNPLHSLCYDEPEIVVIVEIIRNICCLSVLKDFFKFRKYNLHEVVKSSVNGKNLTSVPKDKPNDKEVSIEADKCEKTSEKEVSSEVPIEKETVSETPLCKEKSVSVEIEDKADSADKIQNKQDEHSETAVENDEKSMDSKSEQESEVCEKKENLIDISDY